jgi:hypothetical protein
MLDIHRDNYDANGPTLKKLQLLWWEWPPEHWDGIRDGSSMHFMVDPVPDIKANAAMTPEQLPIAIEFVEELEAIRALGDPKNGDPILCNAPLFILQKDNQPGEWRILADWGKGEQNCCMGNDPVFLPIRMQILDSMYTGGYGAVTDDGSKFFYQFPTRADEQKYLSRLHPGTGRLRAYQGLPMGSGNSPPAAGRYGLSFCRLVRQSFAVFQGAAEANCYWTSFSSIRYHPHRGYGYVLRGTDGCAVLLWVWVDDFLVHGPTCNMWTSKKRRKN